MEYRNQDCLGFPYVGQYSSLRSGHRFFLGAKRENSRTRARGEERRGHLLSPSRVPLARPLKKINRRLLLRLRYRGSRVFDSLRATDNSHILSEVTRSNLNQNFYDYIKRVLEVTEPKKATCYSRNGRKMSAYFHRFDITNNQLWIFCILRRLE